MKKYVFKKYDKKFKQLFYREKSKLKKIIPKSSLVEHGGSTAIKNLGGKGIIDIFIGVEKSLIDKTKKALEKFRYIHKPNKSKEREYFEKDYIYNKKTRRIHIHLSSKDSPDFKRVKAFVKYLNLNPKKAKEYALLKKKAVKYAKGEGKKYRDYKKKFLDKIGKEALK